ncbi:MAG: MFS transporter [Mycobacteriales bacterium]
MLSAADAYVVVLALPDIMSGVGVGLDELQRATPIITGFLLGYVAALPLIGRLADIYGRVPALVGCLAVFAFGSLLTAGADGLGIVVAGRALQGVGAGGLVPATLALVADRWPPQRRGIPLGAVGAAQEVGAVVGPLYGGAILAVTSWRAIFWANLAGAVVLTGALVAVAGRPGTVRSSGIGSRNLAGGLVGVAGAGGVVLLLTRPAGLVDSVRYGGVYLPLAGGTDWFSPLAVMSIVLLAGAVAILTSLTGIQRLFREVDLVGAVLLALALGGVILAFAGADPRRQVVGDNAAVLLAVTAVCAGLLVWHQRRIAHPLVPGAAIRPRPAWGAMVVNLFVGAALVAALVDVPIFARATRYPHSQLGAALVLVEFLVALPIGALAGGWLTHRMPPRLVASIGMALATIGFAAMSRWTGTALDGPQSTVVLVVTGLGFGLAIAPVNAAVLAATRTSVHGIASALVVVARTLGMLVGLAALTAVGLRIFYGEQDRIGSPLTLCPRDPAHCPAYTHAIKLALLSELRAIFVGAALCAALATVLAAVLLRVAPAPRRSSEGAPLPVR